MFTAGRRIQIQKTPQQISRLFMLSVLLMVLPFAITDIVFIGTNSSICLSQGAYGQLTNLFSYFYLGEWLFNDGLIKLAIVIISFIMAKIRRTAENDRIVIAAYGNILSLFWSFILGWSIAGGILYWSNIDPANCDSSLNVYMYIVLITSYIFCIVGFIISLLRPSSFSSNHLTIEKDSQSGRRQNTIMN